jgi:hypothetical protein
VSVIVLLIAVQQGMLPLVEHTGHINNMRRRLLIAGNTIGATVFSVFLAGRMRHLLLRSFDEDIRKYMSEREEAQRAEKQGLLVDSTLRRQSLRRLNREWRGVLGIDSFGFEKFINYRYHLLWAMCALNTTAIVVALTPSDASRDIAFQPVIPGTGYAESIDEHKHPCIGMAHSDDIFGEDLPERAWPYRWQLTNGSTFYIGSPGDAEYAPSSTLVDKPGTFGFSRCTPPSVMRVIGGVNKANVSDHAYSVEGISIDRSALGASRAIFNLTNIQALQKRFRKSIIKTTQCVPVMVRNPVECRVGGTLNVTRSGREGAGAVLRVQAGNGTCWTEETLMRQIPKDSTMMATTCVDAPLEVNRTADYIGRSVAVIGALNSADGNTPNAYDLAKAMGDPNYLINKGGGVKYVVTCSINPRDAFDYRLVTLDFHPRRDGRGFDSGSRYYLSAEKPCKPVNPTISNILFATASFALRDLVRENTGNDHQTGTIFALTAQRPPPYAFDNSRNSLEDVLGLAAATGVSFLPLSDNFVVAASNEDQSLVTVEATRLGTDHAVVYITLLPPILSFIVLSALLAIDSRKNWRSRRGAGAEDRGGIFAADNLSELLS